MLVGIALKIHTSDLTESFYQRLPGGGGDGEMLHAVGGEKGTTERRTALGSGGLAIGDGVVVRGMRVRLDVYIRTNHRPAGTVAQGVSVDDGTRTGGGGWNGKNR